MTHRSNFLRFLRVSAVGFYLLCPFSHIIAQESGEDRHVVAMELLESNHIAVEAMVNGQGPYRLIFDTGSPLVLVSSRLAEEVGLRRSRAGSGRGRRARRQSTANPLIALGLGGQATVDSLELGGAEVEGLPVFIMDHPAVEMLASAVGDLDGIIGLPFFARFEMEIDYEAATLSFAPSDFEGGGTGDVMQELMDRLFGGDGGVAIEGREVVLGLTLNGALPMVRSVAPGSAAEEAGLMPGDTFVLFDGRWIETAADVEHAVSPLPPDEDISMTIIRRGEEMELSLRTRRGL